MTYNVNSRGEVILKSELSPVQQAQLRIRELRADEYRKEEKAS